ncbi:hypothetical protein KS4_18810 [Poriferisphaera corsica]|uniref:Uncharacterized protein n=1 Tax=Poriferisphaera corsica TaxID=2528020 RepID=A0A517YU99_9BACT|nr:hypothetical protein [Poriferisphaera corsica]QDU33823.1 hypothetical protein KS4_18810 [Poriferisphaera corsica]
MGYRGIWPDGLAATWTIILGVIWGPVDVIWKMVFVLIENGRHEATASELDGFAQPNQGMGERVRNGGDISRQKLHDCTGLWFSSDGHARIIVGNLTKQTGNMPKSWRRLYFEVLWKIKRENVMSFALA